MSGSQSRRSPGTEAPTTTEAPPITGPTTAPAVAPAVAPAGPTTDPTAGPEQRTGISLFDLAIVCTAIIAGETDRIGEYLDRADPILTWLVDHGYSNIVLELAGGLVSAHIVAAVNRTGTLDRIVAGGNCDSQVRHQGMFALIGDATTRTRTQLDAARAKLFPATRILAAGEMPNTVWGVGIPQYTDTTVTPNRTYSFAKRAVSVDPSDSGMAMFFDIMPNVPRNALAATHTLQFAAEEEYHYLQTGVSPEWRAWSPSIRRPMPTSYAGVGVVVLEAKAAGTTQLQTARAVDGTVSPTATTVTNASGDVSRSHVESDSAGTATRSTSSGTRSAPRSTRTCPPPETRSRRATRTGRRRPRPSSRPRCGARATARRSPIRRAAPTPSPPPTWPRG